MLDDDFDMTARDTLVTKQHSKVRRLMQCGWCSFIPRFECINDMYCKFFTFSSSLFTFTLRETGFVDWNRKREISLIIYSKLQRVRAQVFIHRGGGLCDVGIRPSRRAYLELH